MNKFRTFDGLSLAYQEYGHGQPVLCLAGLTRNSCDFECLVEYLDDVHLIMMDYRGRGESDWDPNTLNYNPHVEAQDAFELLNYLHIDKVKIIGTSRGGIVSMLMAATNRERINGILFNDIGPEVEPLGLEYILQHLSRNPACSNLNETAKWLAEISTDFVNVSLDRWYIEACNRYRHVGNQIEINYDPGLRAALIAALDDEKIDLWSYFRNLEGIKLALIRGANSNLLSAQTANKMKEFCPNLVLTHALNRGHCPFLDEPESLQAIRNFLSGGNRTIS